MADPSFHGAEKCVALIKQLNPNRLVEHFVCVFLLGATVIPLWMVIVPMALKTTAWRMCFLPLPGKRLREDPEAL